MAVSPWKNLMGVNNFWMVHEKGGRSTGIRGIHYAAKMGGKWQCVASQQTSTPKH
jgi:hypothetical protein